MSASFLTFGKNCWSTYSLINLVQSSLVKLLMPFMCLYGCWLSSQHLYIYPKTKLILRCQISHKWTSLSGENCTHHLLSKNSFQNLRNFLVVRMVIHIHVHKIHKKLNFRYVYGRLVLKYYVCTWLRLVIVKDVFYWSINLLILFLDTKASYLTALVWHDNIKLVHSKILMNSFY